MKNMDMMASFCLIFVLSSVFLFGGLNAFKVAQAAQEASPQDSSLSVDAWDYYYDKQFDKAIELFNQEAKSHADWCDPYDGLGWAYLQKGDFKKAEDNFKKSLGIYEYYANSLTGMAEIEAWKYRRFNRAWGFYYAGNFNKAASIFNEILSDKLDRLPKKEIWRAHNGLGWSYFGIKDFDKALAQFNEAASDQKNDTDTLKGLGFVYFEKNKLDEAMKNLQSSLSILAYQPDVQSKIAWIYHKNGDYKKALEEFEKAKKINPYLAEPYRGIAWTYYEMKDYARAKDYFIQGIKIYPSYIADEKFKLVLKGKKDWSDLYTLLGWSSYHNALYNDALQAFDFALKELGENADILRGSGYTYYKLGNFDQAKIYLEKSLQKDPGLAPVEEYITVPGTIAAYLVKSDAQSSLAWTHYYREEYDQAIKYFKEVINRHPDWVDAHDGLAWVYFMQKSYGKAEESFKNALSFNPYYADALNGLTAINQTKYGKSGIGWSYYYRGDYKTALNQFNEILKGRDPNFPKDQLWSIHNGAGWSYYRLGDFSKAETEFRQVLQDIKDNVDAMVGLGYVLFQKKNYTEAKDKLTEALKLVPDNYDALTSLGWAYYKTNDFSKAVDVFKKAISINAYLVDPYLGLGLSDYKNNDKKNAKDALGTAIDIYPDYVMTDEFKQILEKEQDWLDLYGRLGWSYYYVGLFDKASNMFAAELKKNPNSQNAQMGLGSIYFQQGDYKAAIAKLEPLLSGKPQEEKGWYKWSYVLSNLGWCYFYSSNPAKALDYFKQLLALHKNDDIYAEPYSGIGWCLLKNGDSANAEENFLKAVKLAPGYLSAVNGLAELDKLSKAK